MTRAALIAILCTVVGAAPASAATRTASPGATGDCVNTPCDFTPALEGAGNNDEVIVQPGDYTTSHQIMVTANVNVHGVEGAPRPRITRTSALEGLVILGRDTVRHLEFVGQAGTASLAFGGELMEDVVSRQQDSNAGCLFDFRTNWPTHTVRNTVCTTPTGEGIRIPAGAGSSARTATLRNVTAVGAVNSEIDPQGNPARLNIVNSIIRPGVTFSGTQAGAYHLSNNNYASRTVANAGTVVDEGPNYTDTPIFAGAGTGDFHQDRFSPTIDRGADSVDNGPFDFDGDLRTIGLQPDIGADEFVPAPGTTTGSATDVSPTEATLSAAVESKGAPTDVRFEWGTTPAYGNSIAAGTLPASNGSAPVSVRLTGLAPGTPYHYRVVATNKTGSSAGENASFTTAPAPPPPPTGTGSGGTPPDLPEFEFPSRRKPPVASGAVRTQGKYLVARIKGTLKPPDGVSRARACDGKVTLSLFKGKKRLVKGDDELSSKCAFSKTLKVRKSKVGSAKTLKLVIEFSGNDAVGKSSASYTLKVK